MRCPTPEKKAYGKRIDAMLGLLNIQERREDRGDPKVETAAYHCQCGKYHLTSKRERGSGRTGATAESG